MRSSSAGATRRTRCYCAWREVASRPDVFATILQLAMQATTIVPFVPILFEQLAGSDVSIFTVGAAQLAGSPQGDGTGFSILCHDFVPLVTPEVLAAAAQGVNPDLVRALQQGTVDLFAGPCPGWTGITPISSPPAPVTSDLPTLVLSGEYDPSSPPAYAHEVAATLGRSTVVEFSGHAHGQLYVADSCAMNVIAQFIADPAHEPDTSCAAAIPPPHFVGS